MSAAPDRASAQKRRSFLVLVSVLIVGAAVAAFALGRGDRGAAAGSRTPGGGSGASGAVTLQKACAEIPPDMALRVDALRRTAQLVRADVVTMQAAGDSAGAAQATKVADALDAAAAAVDSEKGVSRATRLLGQTLASIC